MRPAIWAWILVPPVGPIDVPTVAADLIVMPGFTESLERRDVAAQHLEWVQANYWTIYFRFPGRPEIYKAWLASAERRWKAWYHLYQAHIKSGNNEQACEWHLNEVRKLIGSHSYYQGQMPSAVPGEFFPIKR